MESNISKQSETQSNVEDFSIGKYMKMCLRKWIWFVMSLILCVGLGLLYIYSQQPVYERTEEILIKDQEAGGGIAGMSSTFASLGLVSGSTNVNNELISITSPSVLSDVIKILHLNVDYTRKGSLHGTTLYGTTLPFEVKFLNLGEQQSASFKCKLLLNGKMSLSHFISYSTSGDKIKYNEIINNVGIGDTVDSPLGKIIITRNDKYINAEETQNKNEEELKIEKIALQTAIETYSDKITGILKDEYADVIELTIKDVNVERAEDILRMILEVYNKDWVDDKNKIANATSSFIEDRLMVIEQELGEADETLAKKRSQLGIPGIGSDIEFTMEASVALDKEIVDLNNRLEMSKFLSDFLAKSTNDEELIPVNSGINNEEIENLISTYNSLLISRDNLISNSSENNPLVDSYNSRLIATRQMIEQGVRSHINNLNTSIKNVIKEKNKNLNKISETPLKTFPVLTDNRQQKVKEELYLFLLQKREENQLSQKFTADNTRLITPPMGPLRPVSPKKAFIMLFMVFLGMAIPMVCLFIKMTNDTKVRSKKDLEKVKIPFAGEIPQVGKPTKLKAFDTVDKLRHRKDEKAPLAVVQEGNRDVVNEAFRVIRSNIDFMSGKNAGKAEVIMLTSFNPGSGKSFVSYNLGISFAIKKKRVLLIDCDLRHGSTSMYVGMPNKGITNYLTDSTDDWRSLVKKTQSNPSIDILPVGKMPPNPAELLETDRMEKLIDDARQDYDVILLDCPPVNIVVDAQIIGQMSDRTLFVVRAGLLEKSALTELNEFYSEKKFKNMSLLLNGTEAAHSRYYTYGTYQSYND